MTIKFVEEKTCVVELYKDLEEKLREYAKENNKSIQDSLGEFLQENEEFLMERKFCLQKCQTEASSFELLEE